MSDTLTLAYEVFYSANGYSNRTLVGIFWDKEYAEAIAEQERAFNRKVSVSAMHVVKIGEKWHRYYVRPLTIHDSITECISTDSWNCKYCKHVSRCTLHSTQRKPETRVYEVDNSNSKDLP